MPGNPVRGSCRHAACTNAKETNTHVVAECGRYAAARSRFEQCTGVRISRANYVSVMAFDGPALGVASASLTTPLYQLLASIFGTRYYTQTSSVAHSLGLNQGRFAVAGTRQPAAASDT